MSLETAFSIMSRPMSSALITTTGAALTILDAANTLRAAANPVVFTVAATVGVIFGTITYSLINEQEEAVSRDSSNRSVKHGLLSIMSVILGIIPGIVARIISVTTVLFCGPAIGGFRLGFLGAQAIWQGRETYPMLKLQAE